MEAVEPAIVTPDGQIQTLEYDPKRVYDLPLSEIEDDEDWNCRGYIDPTDVIELANNIRERGLDQPVTVIPNKEGSSKKFKLIAGYRRFKAHKVIKAEKIPAIVRTGLNETDARIFNLVENVQRKELNIKQEAHAIAKFRFMQPKTVAEKVGKSKGWVDTRLMLLELPEDIQDEAAAGRLTGDEIRTCSKLGDDEAMRAYVRRVKENKIRGNKREVNPDKVVASNKTALRSALEMEEVQDIIRELFGNNLATKSLGWAAGLVTPMQLHQYIQQEAEKVGKFYDIPDEIERAYRHEQEAADTASI